MEAIEAREVSFFARRRATSTPQGREGVLYRALVGGEELEKRTAATAVKHSLVLFFFFFGFHETGGSGVD